MNVLLVYVPLNKEIKSQPNKLALIFNEFKGSIYSKKEDKGGHR